MDPARYGNDSSVICIKRGLEILPFVSFHGINTTRLTGEVVRIVKDIRKKQDEKEKGIEIEIRVDDTGIGGGVTDQLEEQAENDPTLNIDIIPVNNGSPATDEDFFNLGAQSWGDMKEALKTISIPDDPELISQLTTRKYKIRPDGRIQLEEKDRMKARGVPSPDRADALALTIIQPSTGGVAWV